MRTEYLDELCPYQLRKKLSEMGIELTDDQYRSLVRCERTFLYAPRVRKRKGSNIWFRISIPIYAVWVLFLRFIVQPIKWVLCGNQYFDTNNPIYRFTILWERNVGL